MRRAWLIVIAVAIAVATWFAHETPARLEPMTIEVAPMEVLGPIDSPRVVRMTTRTPHERPRIQPTPPPIEPPPIDIPNRPELDPTYLTPPTAFEVGLWPMTLPDDAPRSPAPTTPPARLYDPDVATRLLQGGVHERDKTSGLALPGASRIAEAIANAARAHAPPVSLGSFTVHIGADGRIRSVRLSWFRDGKRSAWERIADDTARHLAGATFPLSSALARGAFVEVQVASNVALPSGNGRDRDFERGRRLEKPRWPWSPAPGPRLSRREEGTWTPLPPDLERVSPPPESTFPPCDPGEKLCPGFRFDVADLVTKKARVVHTLIDVSPARGPIDHPIDELSTR